MAPHEFKDVEHSVGRLSDLCSHILIEPIVRAYTSKIEVCLCGVGGD